jgi:hypothetical protein
VRFSIVHELDAPLDAVELAVLSPTLGDVLARKLHTAHNPSIESVETISHDLENDELRRVLRFQASAPLSVLKGYEVARDAMSWEETSTYRLRDHAASWSVAPKEQYRKYFRSSGTYRLESAPGGRTRRLVDGEMEIHVRVIGGLVERMALAEVKKTYDAEAEALRALATL